jgi:hypothetical protein
MKPIRLTEPYFVSVGGGYEKTNVQLLVEAALERRTAQDTRNARNRWRWRQRYQRNPVEDAAASTDLAGNYYGAKS